MSPPSDRTPLPPARPMPTRPETIRTRRQRQEDRAPSDEITVMVHGLRIAARIGVHDHERGRIQPIIVDIDVTLAAGSGPSQDDMAEALDYKAIADAAETLATERHTHLVETLAGGIADWCLRDPRAARVRVVIRKPEALVTADWAGCMLERTRA